MLLLEACIQLRGDGLPHVAIADIKIRSDQKTKIAYTSVDQKGRLNPPYAPKEPFTSRLDEDFLYAVKLSGCCTVASVDEADILIKEVNYIHELHELFEFLPPQLWVSAISLTTIPVWHTGHGKRSFYVSNKQKSKKYEIETTSTILIWLPLMACVFCNEARTAASRTRDKIYKTLILKMKEDGFF